MKKLKSIESSQYDTFEVPENLWNRVEQGLDEKSKKRWGIIWWQVAAGVAVLLTAGILTANYAWKSAPTQLAQNNTPDEKQIEPTVIPSNPEDSVQVIKPTVDVQPEEPQENPATPLFPVDSILVTLPRMDHYPSEAIVDLSTVNNATYNVTFSSDGSGANLTSYLTTIPGVTTGNASTLSGAVNQGYTSYGFTTPVNTPSSGIIDGIYTQQHIPTKRTIPYEYLREADILVLNGEQSIGKLSLDSIQLGIGTYQWETTNTSNYDEIIENDYIKTLQEPLSTFSIDVDGAAYSDVRGMINRDEIPNKNAVRLEEFVNYFPYEYEDPTGEHPFSIHSEIGTCPWNPEHQLLKVGIKGQSIEKGDLPKNNLVFLLDVSGSMDDPEKLELLKKGFRMLVNELREDDRVAISVYAGAAGVVLPPTSGANKDKILDALNRLNAGGSTAGGEGIELAYKLAEKHFDTNGNNRIILATDGDFNVGISNDDQLVELIEEKRKSGVFLTVLGFGHDNFQSSKMEKLANNGNGNFSFIDNVLEAKKVLVTEMGATLLTIAKDVKIQMEFNPAHVGSYRLIGYENRLLQNQDFANDTIDAGELGAGHTVTAMYEIIPAGTTDDASSESGLKYSKVTHESNELFADEMATMKFRYKQPDGDKSILIERPIFSADAKKQSSQDFEFIQSVVEFGLILRESKYQGTTDFDRILETARKNKGEDPYGYRSEFIRLVEKTKVLWDGKIAQ